VRWTDWREVPQPYQRGKISEGVPETAHPHFCGGEIGRPRLKGTRPAEIFFTAGLGQVKKVFRGWELR
jgi:hypothetical protein